MPTARSVNDGSVPATRGAASLREELLSALTHGLGATAALAGGAVLVTLAALYGDGWQLAGAIVFGISLLLLYLASTLYHAIQHPVAKARLKVFDHCAIYLLIAGTYTPFTLIGLRGPWGWSLFAAIWTLALAGVVFKLFFTGRFKLLSTAIYIAMGWLVIVAIKPLLGALDALDPRLAVRRRRRSTRSARCSTTGLRCRIRTRSGTCSWSPAASAITSR